MTGVNAAKLWVGYPMRLTIVRQWILPTRQQMDVTLDLMFTRHPLFTKCEADSSVRQIETTQTIESYYVYSTLGRNPFPQIYFLSVITSTLRENIKIILPKLPS